MDSVPKEKIYSKQEELLVSPIVTHALYLLNIASENEALVAKSIAALEYDMAFDSLVKGSGIVVHLGSDQGRGWEAVREQVAKHIKTIISKSPSDATFLIENSAGQQGKIPSNFEHIRWLLDQVNSPQLGWCFDTCHSFAAGYALGKVGAKEKALIDRNQRELTAPEAIEKYDLWSSLKCIHVNDSKGVLGSGLDRHENLGQGQIPLEDLRSFLNLRQLHDLPLILEVPGYDGTGPDAQNVQFLKDLVTP